MSAAMQGELELSTVDGCSDAAPGRHLDGDGLCQCRSACCLGQGTSLTVCLCTRGCECDQHRVEAWDSSSVEAWDSAAIAAYGEVEVRAGSHVAVHLHSQLARVEGGVVIDVTALRDLDARAWAAYAGVAVREDGTAVLYKAVDQNLMAGHQHIATSYPIGLPVEASDWRDDTECGGGLHFSPSPIQARAYHAGGGEPRFLEVEVDIDQVRVLGHDRVKAPACLVVREVDEWRDPVEAPAAAGTSAP